MKRALIFIIVLTLILGVFTSCTKSSDTKETDVSEQKEAEEAEEAEETQTSNENEPTSQSKQEEKEDNSIAYAFEFEDITGKVHKLSDYRGKPVYLEVWGSWCSVCMSLLPEMDILAGEAEDFHVLSIVIPNKFGEKSKDDFIEWFNELEYKNLIVLLDEQGQIMDDFGVSAFPSQIFFDAEGNFVNGMVGGMTPDMIKEEMSQIVESTN